MKSKLFLSLALLSFSSSAFAVCDAWDKNCQDIGKFRKARATKFGQAAKEDCPNCNTPPAGGMTAVNKGILGGLAPLAKSNSYDPEKFMSCLNDYSSFYKTLNEKDVNTLKKAFQTSGIGKLSAADIESIFIKPNGSFREHMKRVKTGDPGKTPFLREYALNGPYGAVIESLTGEAAITTSSGSFNTIAKTMFAKSGMDELKEVQASDSNVIDFLFARAMQTKDPMYGGFSIYPGINREPITPGVAKIILFEILRDRLRNKQPIFKKLIADLNIKFDFRNPSSSPSTVDQVGNTDSVSITNGYFLGAPPQNFPKPGKVPYATGIDCTTFIQTCQAKAGLTFPSGYRLFSGDLTSVGQGHGSSALSSLYRGEKLRCEEQLVPGDVVAFKGHAFVFAGYKKDPKGKYQIVTMEAKGDNYRFVGEYFREIYLKESCDSAVFSTKGDKDAYIIRVR